MPFALALLMAIQSDRLPPANPLPPPGTEEGAVLAPVQAMLAGLAAHDAAAILAQVRPDGNATAVAERPDGGRSVTRRSLADFAAAAARATGRVEEVIRDPAVEIDGDMAMVWAPYVFRVDGRVSHCGTDHFALVREDGRWRIQNATWTQRGTGCE